MPQGEVAMEKSRPRSENLPGGLEPAHPFTSSKLSISTRIGHANGAQARLLF
jgi:hypothetical protein